MDGFNFIPRNRFADVQVFLPNYISAAGAQGQAWRKRPGVTFVEIFALGGGGGGGTGAVGAASTAAGGGGGGSAAQSSVRFIATMIPDALTVQVGHGGAPGAGGSISDIFMGYDNSIAIHRFLRATGGNAGGNASGATGGSAGTGGSGVSLANHPRAGVGVLTALTGATGAAGGVNGSLPTTGLVVTGGAGGGSLGAGVGQLGRAIAFGGIGAFPELLGGAGATSTTTSASNGANGFQPIPNLPYWYGGSGGGTTRADSPTGAGLIAGNGGDAAYGSGGGGGGGAFTGGTAGVGGRGGDGLVIITSW